MRSQPSRGHPSLAVSVDERLADQALQKRGGHTQASARVEGTLESGAKSSGDSRQVVSRDEREQEASARCESCRQGKSIP